MTRPAAAAAAWPPVSYFDAGTAAAAALLLELELLERRDWRELYRRRADGSHWRLDADDKYQQRFLVRIDDVSGWASFDASPLEQQLLLAARGGTGPNACIRMHCMAPALSGSAFCLQHSYEQGMRK